MHCAWYQPPGDPPRGHAAPSALPRQTNRDLAHNHEGSLMRIVVLLSPCAPPERVPAGSRAPGEPSVGFRVGCSC